MNKYYGFQCNSCNKTFITFNIEQKTCATCLKKPMFIQSRSEEKSLPNINDPLVFEFDPTSLYADSVNIPKREWIKCSDRWPEIDIPVLIYNGITQFVGWRPKYGSEFRLDFEHSECCRSDCGHVTHWMPLPESPK